MMNRMKELREERGLTMKETASRLGMPYTTYVNYEKSLREPNSETLIKIASFFQVSVDYLLGYVSEPEFYLDNQRIIREINKYDPPDPSPSKIRYDYSHIKNVIPVPKIVKHIPLYDGIACGDPRYADSAPVDTIGIPDTINADFAIRCHGDSMVNARIHDGDIVYVRQQPDVDDGQIAAVLIDDDATLKRVYHKPYGVLLMPANEDYEPIVYTETDCVNIKIMGRAVAVTFAVK